MRLEWDKTGEHFYETGIDHCVLYPYDTQAKAYNSGVAWNGISSIAESPSGAEASPVYADNIKYLNLISTEEFAATVEAYTYPDEFAVLDGSVQPVAGAYIGQQARGTFGLSYRSRVGNDVDGDQHGYKIHLIYGAQAAPSEKSYATVNDSPEAATMSWSLNTTPVALPKINGQQYKPTATLIIDSTKVNGDKLADLEDVLYGTDGSVTYTKVVSPTGNPVENAYYELVEGSTTEYVLSQDTTVTEGKDYYTRTETGGTNARLPLPGDVISMLSAG